MLTQRLKVFLPENAVQDAAEIREMISLFRKHPGSCTDVWLPTAYGYPTRKRHAEIAAHYGQIAAQFRAAGIRVSMQVSNTIGHGGYMKSRDCSGIAAEGLDQERLVGDNGMVADYCFCWRGERFRRYCAETTAVYCGVVRPDRIFVDDDLRAVNHFPVQRGCFCPRCLADFNRQYTHSYSRAELVQALNHGPLTVREEWIAFLREGLYRFVYELTEAIVKASPETSMGLQNGANGWYTGYSYDFIFRAMANASGKKVGFRPGAGAYDDNQPMGFLEKARCLEWQCASLPEELVDDIRPEIECLPCVAYGKSANGLAFETDVYFAYGATAMSYAMLGRMNEPLAYHEKELALFARHAPYWRRLADLNRQTRPSGVALAASEKSYLRSLAPEEPDFAYARPHWDISEDGLSPLLGIPLAYRSGDAERVYVLTEQDAEALTAEDVARLLTLPVLAEGKAICTLIRRGFDAFGIVPYRLDAETLAEEFLPGPCSPVLPPQPWSQSYFDKEAVGFLPTRDGVTALSRYTGSNASVQPLFADADYPFGIAALLTQTDGGGTWAVFGQTPCTFRISYARREQIFAALDAVSHGQALKAKVVKPVKAVILPRVDCNDRVAAVSVIPMTTGESGPLTVWVRRPAGHVFSFRTGETEVPSLPYTVTRTGETEEVQVTLPSLPGYTVGTLFCE